MTAKKNDAIRITHRPMQYIKVIHISLATILTIAFLGFFAVESSIFGAAFFFPFIMTPIVVNLIAAKYSTSIIAQIILLPTTMIYAAWAIYLYIDVMLINTDPQSAIALLFIAIIASPVLLVVWLLSLGFELLHRRS